MLYGFEMQRVIGRIEWCTSLCLHVCDVTEHSKQDVLPARMHMVPHRDKRTSHKRASKTCGCRLSVSVSVQGGTVRKTQIGAVLRKCVASSTCCWVGQQPRKATLWRSPSPGHVWWNKRRRDSGRLISFICDETGMTSYQTDLSASSLRRFPARY
jgi:hypothetical protein